MKHTLFFFLLGFFVFFNGSAASEINKRMIVLIDQEGIEKVGGKSAATSILALALHQKASSIISSYSIIRAFLDRKYYQQNQKDIYRLTNFNASDWKIYHLKNSNFFFFTPKNEFGLIQDLPVQAYGQQFYSYEKVLVKEKDIEQGMSVSKEIVIPLLKVDNIEPFTVVPENIQNLNAWINQKKQPNRIFEIVNLESLFFYENDFKAMQPLLQELSFIDKNVAQKIKNKEKEFEKIKISAPKEALQEKLEFIRSITKPWNFFVFGHGSYEYPPQGKTYSIPTVANLRAIDDRKINPIYGKPNQLTPFLLFFNKINTRLLALSSCYSGGKNLNYVRFKEGLKKEKIPHKLNYILAVLSSTDAETTLVTGFKSNYTAIDWDTSTNSERFFQSLERHSDYQADPNWLTNALSALALPLDHPENIPQVLIPGQEWFQVFTPAKVKNKNVIILDDDLIKQHQQKKTALAINSDKKVFLKTRTIPVSVAIDASKPLPQFISKVLGDTFHVFNKISVTNVSGALNKVNEIINGYIDTFFLQTKLKSYENEKVFFIKTFELLMKNNQRVPFENLLVTVSKGGWGFQTLTHHDAQSKKYSGYLVNPPVVPIKEIKNKEILSLGNTLIKKHEIENIPLDLTGAQTVLLSEPIIPIDIFIDGAITIPQFISRIPGEASHAFKKIVIQNAMQPREESLKRLFFGAMQSIGEAEKKFFVQELDIFASPQNKQSFKNILITAHKNQFDIKQLPHQNSYSAHLDRVLAEKSEWKIANPELVRSEQESFAKKEQERSDKEEQEKLDNIQAEQARIAREEQERLTREKMEQVSNEEKERLAKEQLEKVIKKVREEFGQKLRTPHENIRSKNPAKKPVKKPGGKIAGQKSAKQPIKESQAKSQLSGKLTTLKQNLKQLKKKLLQLAIQLKELRDALNNKSA